MCPACSHYPHDVLWPCDVSVALDLTTAKDARAEDLLDEARKLATVLRGLGAAYRSDWSEFDGRTLFHQLTEVARALESPSGPLSVRATLESLGVCVRHHQWADRCQACEAEYA